MALPSTPESASRTAPVAVLVAATLASFTAASLWSATTTVRDDVFGDCAAAGIARNASGSANGKVWQTARMIRLVGLIASIPGPGLKSDAGWPGDTSPIMTRDILDHSARYYLR